MKAIEVLKNVSKDLDVLYVEDDEEVSKEFILYLRKLFHRVDLAEDGEEGLSFYKKNKYDLIITDIQMPKMDGLEMAAIIKEINEEQNILVVSAYSDNDKFIDSIKLGVDGYILKPVDYANLNVTIYKVANKIKKFKEHKEYEKNLEAMVEKQTRKNVELEIEKANNYKQVLFALIGIVESRDSYTGAHSLRVAKYSKIIAQDFGLSVEECDDIYTAGMLHDLGKIAIPDSLLLNPSKLTSNEYSMIKEHVSIGYDMLSKITIFHEIAEIINCHHERLDGSGYPKALKGDEIPLKANIMAVADTFDAMTTNRVYKARMTREEALLEIQTLSGISFRADIVEVALKALKYMNIDSSISQTPKNNIEEERFSYFYKDNLTHLYNEKYLDFILVKNVFDKHFIELNLIFIDRFAEYNKKHKWSKGNKLLVSFSDTLITLCDNKFIFRIHGDIFVILNTNANPFDASLIDGIQSFMDEYNEDIKIKSKTLMIHEHDISSIARLEMLF